MFADRAAKSAREDSLVQGGGGKKAPEASGVERESDKPLGHTTRLHTGQSLFSFTPQITARPVSPTTDRDRRRLIAVLIRISAELRRQRMLLVFETKLDECRDKEGEREREREKEKERKGKRRGGGGGRGGVGSAM